MQSASFTWALAAATPAVLVTVAATEGSVPRGPGTRMMVSGDSFAGTVGGGHLELRAIEIARAMLQSASASASPPSPPPPRLERFPLGPSLGQCCGGVVHLAFETVTPEHAALMQARRNQDSWRIVDLHSGALSVLDGAGAPVAGALAPACDRSGASHLMQAADGRRYLVAQVAAPRDHLLLFGAGHVGTALVRALADLPCTVTWVDERADLFPAALPANVCMVATDAPEDAVAAAPADACYLVMTHSHALDQRIIEAVLARPQVAWCGLIGSRTKRMQFEHRLRARGLPEARIGAMACPIGVPGIAGKEPAVIAVAVAAQLLMLWEERARGHASDHASARAGACATIAPDGPY